jgi:hypothetical protein
LCVERCEQKKRQRERSVGPSEAILASLQKIRVACSMGSFEMLTNEQENNNHDDADSEPCPVESESPKGKYEVLTLPYYIRGYNTL